jgi:amino acid permease
MGPAERLLSVETQQEHSVSQETFRTEEEMTVVVQEERTPGHESHQLRRLLTERQLNMIVLGGTIGTGLFLGSGQSIKTAGPVGALLSFSAVGLLVYSIVQFLGEMAILLPLPGSFSLFASRFHDRALGFTLGWNYWLQWAVSLRMSTIRGCANPSLTLGKI